VRQITLRAAISRSTGAAAVLAYALWTIAPSIAADELARCVSALPTVAKLINPAPADIEQVKALPDSPMTRGLLEYLESAKIAQPISFENDVVVDRVDDRTGSARCSVTSRTDVVMVVADAERLVAFANKYGVAVGPTTMALALQGSALIRAGQLQRISRMRRVYIVQQSSGGPVVTLPEFGSNTKLFP
jgi:hypothetical protein